MSVFKAFFIEKVITEVDVLEGIGGPDSLEEYIEVLEAIQQEIEERVGNAKARIADGES
jgi:hypothetical protein